MIYYKKDKNMNLNFPSLTELKNRIPGNRLEMGGHDTNRQVCLMEAVAFIAGEEHSDHPECVDTVISDVCITQNDNLDSKSRQELIEVIPYILNSKTNSGVVRQKRLRILLTERLKSIIEKEKKEYGSASSFDSVSQLVLDELESDLYLGIAFSTRKNTEKTQDYIQHLSDIGGFFSYHDMTPFHDFEFGKKSSNNVYTSIVETLLGEECGLKEFKQTLKEVLSVKK